MEHSEDNYFVDHFHEALAAGFIKPYFQPVYRSVTGKMYGAEALARWIDPDYGMISPAEFIPDLESSGQIYELDMEMLRLTCECYHKLCDCRAKLNSFSVNLSRYDFEHDDLFDNVVDTLNRYNVPREAINLEITESMMLEDIETFQKVFLQFRNAGFSIWLDDFGSGYSSLNVLQNYSFDMIKFDMLFLRNFSIKGKQLLASLINMAKILGVHTLVEGVETQSHNDFLLETGCEIQQGYYYAKPMSEAKLIELVVKQSNLAENPEDRNYWNEIGGLNILSPNPLERYADGRKAYEDTDIIDYSTGVSIALLECRQKEVFYVYVSKSYFKCIKDLGYSSLNELEDTFNNHRSDQYLMLKKMVTDAIEQDTVQVVEYVNNDIFYRLRAKCLARKEERAMIALHLSTFDTEQEVKTARRMLNYGNALFSTFELAVMIYPDKNLSTRIYSSRSLPIYDRSGSIKRSVETFCEEVVDSLDQERYLRFMDFKTMAARIESNPGKFIESYFRIKWLSETSNWHIARVTKLPTSAENVYLLTIQSVQGDNIHWLNIIAREHPELF